MEIVVHESGVPTIESSVGEQTEIQETPEATPEPVAETPKATEAPKADDDDVKFKARFAALTRERKAFEQERAKAKEEAKELAKIKEALASAKDNPLKLLEAGGVDYDTLVKFIMNDGKPKPPTVDDEVKTVKQEIETLRKEAEEARKHAEAERAQARAYAELRNAKEHTSKDADRWEVINQFDLHGDVLGLIAHVKENGGWVDIGGKKRVYDPGHVLPMDEAADIVEDILETKQADQLKRLLGMKKMQKYLPKPKPEPVSAPSKPSKTITNAAATANAASQPHVSTVDPDELFEEAVKRLRFTKDQ